MKKINRLRLQADKTGYWDVVGYEPLTFCAKVMPRFGLEPGSDYIMSIRTTPKDTHFKITLSVGCAGFWEWQCDDVPLSLGHWHERFFSADAESKKIMSQIVVPGTKNVVLWVKFRKIS